MNELHIMKNCKSIKKKNKEKHYIWKDSQLENAQRDRISSSGQIIFIGLYIAFDTV